MTPEGSILAHYHETKEIIEAKPYVLEGLGEDLIPANIDFDVIDKFVKVNDRESFLMTRALLKQEAIYTGGSGGAAVAGAIKYAKGLDTPKQILVILPDSGNRYQSKIFNDDWMRINGFFNSSFNVMIKEVLESLGRESQELVTIPDTSKVGEAVKLMEEKGISQLPVTGAQDKVVGMLTEEVLMRPVFEGEINLDENVSIAYDRDFVVVDVHDMLEQVASQLAENKIVLITEAGKVVDILTHIDILNYISEKGKY